MSDLKKKISLYLFNELDTGLVTPTFTKDNCDYMAQNILSLLDSSPVERLEGRYNELIMAVERKFPNESRHETALRYIREAENKIGDSCAVIAYG